MATSLDPAQQPPVPGTPRAKLVRWAWLSVGAALVTIALKTAAWAVTGSVGLLSDALESSVNLVAALGAVLAMRAAHAPADEQHEFGHDKIEYFSSGLEGGLVLAAALAILVAAVQRLLVPEPVAALGVGLLISIVAAAVNLAVGLALRGIGRRERSIALEADGHHLLSDVWTSVGVVIGVGLVGLGGPWWLDPLVAIGVAIAIIRIGVALLRRSVHGLLDAAVAPHERAALVAILDRYAKEHGLAWHALRTREAGARRFVSVHVLVPGEWTVQAGHDLCERLEAELAGLRPPTTVFTHLEPLEDAASFADQALDR
ncbi:MAG: cation diffusion facilitator family transporter [Nannocystaceae bacterium]|nr:cation diffusion facilitator family transporter [Nannocystaceae bacterium]